MAISAKPENAFFSINKPENALKRAEELIHVGQMPEALQVLHDFMKSKRNRGWQKWHEKLMFKHIEICVDLQSGSYAKDGLIQYRSLSQQVNVNSLEVVIKHFLHLSTQKAESALVQAQALQEVQLEVDDLEMENRPEELMLSYVSGEKGKNGSGHDLVTSWFKFLWLSYRTVLEVLKNNSKLEALYAMTAHQAFQFCKKYKRTTESRWLCLTIRNHLTTLYKYRDRPDLSASHSLQLYLDTRFEQLKTVTELQLWQEAFRSVEDIHGLMCRVKKTPKPSLMVIYYAKLIDIFWISSSHLYHAYAWFKLFMLQKGFNKNLNQKDLQLIASSVVLAALVVAPYDRPPIKSHENQNEWNLRITNLIGFNVDSKAGNREILSRSSILSELAANGVIACAIQEVKDLYNILEHEFLPLDLVAKIQPLLSKISKLGGKLASASSVPEVQLSQYVPALEKLATLRLLLQVSQVYQTMKIESLSQMIPFFDFSTVEKISADAVKHSFIAMKVDHKKNLVLFGNLGLESSRLHEYLTIFAESLNKARAMIQSPLEKRSSKPCELLHGLREIVDKEHKRLLARISIMEKRKEEQERQFLDMEREASSKKLKLQKKAEAKLKRLAAERQHRYKQTIRYSVLEEAKDELAKGTTIEITLSKLQREKQGLEKKIQKLYKTVDYLERAKREEASPLIEAAFQQRLVEDKAMHERRHQREIELSRQHHDWNVREKNRLGRILDNKAIFKKRVMSRRKAEFEQQRPETVERINQMIQARKKQREAKRKKIFYVISEEERLQRLREEEAEAKRRRKEEAERKAKLDKIPAASRPEVGCSAPSSGKYVPKFRRSGTEVSGQVLPDSEPQGSGSSRPTPSDSGRWNRSVRQPPPETYRWGSGGARPDGRNPSNDRWRGGSSNSSYWSSSRRREH